MTTIAEINKVIVEKLAIIDIFQPVAALEVKEKELIQDTLAERQEKLISKYDEDNEKISKSESNGESKEKLITLIVTKKCKKGLKNIYDPCCVHFLLAGLDVSSAEQIKSKIITMAELLYLYRNRMNEKIQELCSFGIILIVILYSVVYWIRQKEVSSTVF